MRDASNKRVAQFEAAKPVDIHDLSARWQELRNLQNLYTDNTFHYLGLTAADDGSLFHIAAGKLQLTGPMKHYAEIIEGIHAVEDQGNESGYFANPFARTLSMRIPVLAADAIINFEETSTTYNCIAGEAIDITKRVAPDLMYSVDRAVVQNFVPSFMVQAAIEASE